MNSVAAVQSYTTQVSPSQVKFLDIVASKSVNK